jgi:hypothetical protein
MLAEQVPDARVDALLVGARLQALLDQALQPLLRCAEGDPSDE